MKGSIDLGYHADGTRNRPDKNHEIDDPSLMKLSGNYPKYKDATRKLKDYLDDQLAAFKSEVLSGNYIKPSKLTFKNFYENEWVPKYAAIELKNGTTLESHCSKIKNHVLPKIGHMTIDEITTMILVKLFADMRKPGARVDKKGTKSTLASRTIQYTYDVTNSIFQRATE